MPDQPSADPALDQERDPGVAAADAEALGRYRRLTPLAVGFSVLALAGIIAYTTMVRDDDLRAAFRAFDWRFIPLALGLHIGAHLFWAARYSVLARCFGAPVTVGQAWRIVTAGVFGGAVTPGRLGGEGIKAATMMRGGLSGTQTSRILLADRFTDLVFFLMMGIIALILLPSVFGSAAASVQWFAYLGVAALAVAVTLLVVVLQKPAALSNVIHGAATLWARLMRRRLPKWKEEFEQLVRDVRGGVWALHRESPLRVITAYVLTLANWLAEFAVLWTVLWAFGFAVPFWKVVMVGVILVIVMNIPITPGGSGVAEIVALALLIPLAPGLTAAFVIVWRGLTYYYDIVGGGIMASIMLPRKGHIPTATEE